MRKIATNPSKTEFELIKKTVDIVSHIKKHVAVLVICGPYRTGKSFFISRLLGVKEAFEIGHTAHACTQGIWLSTTALICDEYVLLLLDCEGTDAVGEGERSEETSLGILTLANLLSSFLIYNSQIVPTKTDLSAISCFSGLSAKIMMQESVVCSGEQLRDYLPHFCWIMRDVDNFPSSGISLTAYIKNEILSGGKRDELLRLYPDLECHDLPYPGCDERECLDDSKLDSEFIEKYEEVAKQILRKMKVKEGCTMQPLNGSTMACLTNQYVNAVNASDGIVNLQQCWKSAMYQKISDTVDCLVNAYTSEMTVLERSYPLELYSLDCQMPSLMKSHEKELKKILLQFKVEVTELFGPRIMEDQAYKRYELILRKRIAIINDGTVIGGKLLEFANKNKQASHDACIKLFRSLCPQNTPLIKNDISEAYFDKAIGPAKNEVFYQLSQSIPNSPKNIRISRLTHCSVALKWDAPDDFDFSTGHTLTYWLCLRQRTTNQTIREVEIENSTEAFNELSAVTIYEACLYAVNGQLVGEGIQILFKTLQGPPEKPTILSINPLFDKLSKIAIQYKQPTFRDGNGSPVTHTIVRYKKVGECSLTKIVSDENSCIFLEIENVETISKYLIQISFKNEIGEGEYVEELFDSRNMIPGPPKNFEVVGRGHNRIKLRWEPPTENSASVTHYSLRIEKSTGEINELTLPASKLSKVITRLKSDSKYKFKLKTVNINAQGNSTEEFSEWIETRYHPTARKAIVTGTGVGATLGGPVIGALDVPVVGGLLIKDGIDEGESVSIKVGAAALATTPLSVPLGAVGGTLLAPVVGAVVADVVRVELASDDDLDSDSDSPKAKPKGNKKLIAERLLDYMLSNESGSEDDNTD